MVSFFSEAGSGKSPGRLDAANPDTLSRDYEVLPGAPRIASCLISGQSRLHCLLRASIKGSWLPSCVWRIPRRGKAVHR